jgi:hypothetical protein
MPPPPSLASHDDVKALPRLFSVGLLAPAAVTDNDLSNRFCLAKEDLLNEGCSGGTICRLTYGWHALGDANPGSLRAQHPWGCMRVCVYACVPM